MPTLFSTSLKYKTLILNSVLGGFLLGLSTNKILEIPLSPLAWFCLVPIFFVLKNKHSLKAYFVSSNIFAFTFLVFAGIAFALASFWEGSLLILVSSLLFSMPLILVGILKKSIGFKKSLLMLPLIWPIFDWWFFEKFIAMPNLSISMNQAFLPPIIQYIDITGYTGVTFWLVSINIFIFTTLNYWLTNKPSLLKFGVQQIGVLFFIFFVPPLLYNTYIQKTLSSSLDKKIHVSVVQSKLYNNDSVLSDTSLVTGIRKYALLTDSVVKVDDPDIILWPEGSIPIDFKKQKDIHNFLFRKVLEWETPLLAGTIDSDTFKNPSEIPKLQKYLSRDFKWYNSAVLITPQLAWRVLVDGLDIGNLRLYRKQNLMHFTEYVPLSETFPIVSKLSVDLGGAIHFSKGNGPTSLQFASHQESVIYVSPIICWDLLFSSTSSKSSAHRNDFIAALTNEDPFGDAFTTSSHVVESFTRLRSIENRRSIAKASTVGYSLFTDPFGNVYGRVPWYSTMANTEKISLSTTTTFYNMYPNWFPLFCLGTCILVLLLELANKIKTNKY